MIFLLTCILIYIEYMDDLIKNRFTVKVEFVGLNINLVQCDLHFFFPLVISFISYILLIIYLIFLPFGIWFKISNKDQRSEQISSSICWFVFQVFLLLNKIK